MTIVLSGTEDNPQVWIEDDCLITAKQEVAILFYNARRVAAYPSGERIRVVRLEVRQRLLYKPGTKGLSYCYGKSLAVTCAGHTKRDFNDQDKGRYVLDIAAAQVCNGNARAFRKLYWWLKGDEA